MTFEYATSRPQTLLFLPQSRIHLSALFFPSRARDKSAYDATLGGSIGRWVGRSAGRDRSVGWSRWVGRLVAVGRSAVETPEKT